MSDPPGESGRPLVVFDGDCGFCRSWIARWKSLTGDTVDYEPFQSVADRFLNISVEQFRQAVHLIEPTGRVSTGAAAVFRALRQVPGRGWLSAAYDKLPLFAPLTEAAYRIVATHRPAFARLTSLLWGRHLERPTYLLSRTIFVRLIGLVFLIAFVSFGVQARGLIGSKGLLPVEQFLKMAHDYLGAEAYWQFPSVCWLRADDRFIGFLCASGATLSALVILGYAQGPLLLLIWATYLSLVIVGQDFYSFQWDMLLLESGLLASLIAPWRLLAWKSRGEPPTEFMWLVRLLLFKLMFLSGITKLTYNDPTWHDLTALSFHYETQPLPTILGWYAHQLPMVFHKVVCSIMFVIELAVPFLIFGPRRMKQISFTLFVLFQAAIAATGNYCYFNLLTIVLCVPLLDDAALRRLLPNWLTRRVPDPEPPRPRLPVKRFAILAVATIVLGVSMLEGWEETLGRDSLSPTCQNALAYVRPLRSINGYGLFRVMTTSRPEIIIEGSEDGQEWRAYDFHWKPGDLARPPGWVAPHQPRLDWQMWFAALSAPRRPVWLMNLFQHLLEGSPTVTQLLESNPFPDKPPRYLRAMLYEYHFNDSIQKVHSGHWWRREPIGLLLPAVSLPSW